MDPGIRAGSGLTPIWIAPLGTIMPRSLSVRVIVGGSSGRNAQPTLLNATTSAKAKPCRIIILFAMIHKQSLSLRPPWNLRSDCRQYLLKHPQSPFAGCKQADILHITHLQFSAILLSTDYTSFTLVIQGLSSRMPMLTSPQSAGETLARASVVMYCSAAMRPVAVPAGVFWHWPL